MLVGWVEKPRLIRNSVTLAVSSMQPLELMLGADVVAADQEGFTAAHRG